MGWGLFGVNTVITNILDDNGLYAEWINPGVLAVIEDEGLIRIDI